MAGLQLGITHRLASNSTRWRRRNGGGVLVWNVDGSIVDGHRWSCEIVAAGLSADRDSITTI